MTHVSHGSLQGAPTESSENLTETKLISTLFRSNSSSDSKGYYNMQKNLEWFFLLEAVKYDIRVNLPTR